jgi:hypothetical protein
VFFVGISTLTSRNMSPRHHGTLESSTPPFRTSGKTRTRLQRCVYSSFQVLCVCVCVCVWMCVCEPGMSLAPLSKLSAHVRPLPTIHRLHLPMAPEHATCVPLDFGDTPLLLQSQMLRIPPFSLGRHRNIICVRLTHARTSPTDRLVRCPTSSFRRHHWTSTSGTRKG